MIFTPKNAESFLNLFSSADSIEQEILLTQFLDKMLKIDDEPSFYLALEVLENPILLKAFPDIKLRKQQALEKGMVQLEYEQEQINMTATHLYSIEKRALFYMTELNMVSENDIMELRSKVFNGAEILENEQLLNAEEMQIEASEETLDEAYESITNSNNMLSSQATLSETALSAKMGFHKPKEVPAELMDKLNKNPVKNVSEEGEDNNLDNNSTQAVNKVRGQALIKQALKRLQIVHNNETDITTPRSKL